MMTSLWLRLKKMIEKIYLKHKYGYEHHIHY